MKLPWQKVDNAGVIADMAHPLPPGFRLPRHLVMVEARALAFMGVKASWPTRKLAERWGWGKSQVAEIMREAEAQLADALNSDRTKPGNARTEPGSTGQAMAEERHGNGIDRATAGNSGQSPGTSRARVPSGEIRSRSDQNPPSPYGDCPPSETGGQQEGGEEQGRRAPHRPDFAKAESDRPATPPAPALAQNVQAEDGEGTSAFFRGAGRPKLGWRNGPNLTAMLEPENNQPEFVAGLPVFRDMSHAERTTRHGSAEHRLLAQAWMLWRGEKEGRTVLVPPEAQEMAKTYKARWERHGQR